MGRVALVTGSSGFLGTEFAAELRRREYDVIEVDLLTTGDCRDYFRHQTEPVSLALHCAGYIGGRKGIDGSPLRIAANAALDAMFFQWLETSGTERAVYFSSSAVYPAELQDGKNPRPLVESDYDITRMGHGESSYAISKAYGESMAAMAIADGRRVFVPRTFSGFGASQSLDYPLPSFVDRARRRVDPFPIWSTGNAVRDFVHVDDVVQAVLTAVDDDRVGPCNIASGIGTSFNDLARIICGIAGYSPRIEHIADAANGVDYRVGNPTLMNTFYTPQISLADRLERIIHG